MKEKNKDMIKTLGTGMVLGGIITGGGVYASTVVATNVSYSNASSGLSATTTQQAIDELYKKADNQYFDLATADVNQTGNVFASKKGVCIFLKDRKAYCFKSNNYSVEKNHIKEAFSNSDCRYTSDTIDCYRSCLGTSEHCGANLSGTVSCWSMPTTSTNGHGCYVSDYGGLGCN